ncbi:MAG: anti-sigma factor family protein [Pyrinomonadaceae bacterium]
MKCSDIQTDLTLYANLADVELVLVKSHIEACPLCRQKYDEIREIKRSLKQLPRPAMSYALQRQIKRSVKAETRNRNRSWLAVSPETQKLFNTRIMPYTVGVLASLVMGFTFLALMFSGIRDQASLSTPNPTRSDTVMIAANKNPFREPAADSLSPMDYAQTRLSVSSESPSVNPQGALIALTKSFVRGGMKDDEVVVVADVFGNGLARIAEVVEPSRDRLAVAELQKALASDPAFAPFLPSTIENRPESVRVVLKFQSVNVSTGSRHRNRL